MHPASKALGAAGLIFIVALFASCGGGGGPTQPVGKPTPTPTPPTPGANVQSVSVTAGPSNDTSTDINTMFTSVTVCVPGSTTQCQTIDNIEVDTGSFGLRLLSSVLTVNLPVQPTTGGNSLVECTEFADGYSWGPVALADVQISGEKASSVPVQVIGSSSFPTVPADCADQGMGNAEDSVAAFGANGLLGVGVFVQDCGPACAATAETAAYYSCSQTACVSTTASLATQVTNPVALFATDNNGVIIELPAVPAQGAPTATGSMIFGIDTQTNNKSGNQTVLTVDPNFGHFTTSFNGQSLTESFLDTGSNGLYFNDDSIPQCTDQSFSGFYCPSSTESLGATMQGQNGVSIAVTFSVASAETLASDEPTYLAFPSLAGTTTLTSTFDWGLPFYYGRTVYTAIDGASTSVGTGPYVAF
jgi:hypothetical protein